MEPLSVVDMHTAGEPVRIVVAGYPQLTGRTILEKRREAAEKHDHLRRMMMLEPRGHAGMYGVIPTDPCDPQADLAVLFTHAEGYSTMCGHATIAIARWAVDSGRVVLKPDGSFTLECPCGPVRVFLKEDQSAGFISVPAFTEAEPRQVEVPGYGRVEVDIAYGGAFYAILPSSRLGINWESATIAGISHAAGALLRAAREQVALEADVDPDLRFLYGVIVTDEAQWPHPTRNVCIFGGGQIDRSPTGSGVTARIALDLERGQAQLGLRRRFIGPTGEAFEAAAVDPVAVGGRNGLLVEVTGRAYYSGSARLMREPSDPLGDGFLLTYETAG